MFNKYKKSVKKKLPKYGDGTVVPESSYAPSVLPWDRTNDSGFGPNGVADPYQAPTATGSTDLDYMNSRRTQGTNYGQYAQYAAIAGNTAMQINGINNSDMGEANKTQATSGAVGNGITQGLGTISPYIAAGTGLRKSATSIIGDDKGGNRTLSNWMAAPHEAASNDIGAMKYAENDRQKFGSGLAAIGDITGMTKMRQMFSYGTGNDEKTTGFWGKYNDLAGITSRNNLKKAVNAENGIVENNGGATVMFAGGGMNMQPNAEVEKQENTLNPDGSSTQYNGNSHEMGGIPTQLDPGTLIFSDKLKHQGKTFAKLNMVNNTSKEDKILEDAKIDSRAKQTAALMKQAKVNNSLSLFKIQEELKQDKLGKYAKRIGLSTDNESTEPQGLSEASEGEYAYGGYYGDTIPSYNAKPFNKGYNPNFNFFKTNKNKDFYTDNRRFSEQMRRVEFRTGGEYGPEDPRSEQMIPMQTGFTTPQMPNAPVYNPEMYGTGHYDPSTQELRGNPQIQEVPNYNNTKPKNEENNYNWNDAAYNVGFGLAENAGQLAYLAEQGKRYDTQKMYDYNPALLDPSGSLRYNNMQGRVAAENLKNASNGSAGTYLSNRGALATKQMLANDAIRKDYANTNAQIQNQGQQFNIGNKYRTDEINAQNKGQALTNYYQAIGSVGTNTAQQLKDNKMSKNELEAVAMSGELFDNPRYKKYLDEYLKSKGYKSNKKVGK